MQLWCSITEKCALTGGSGEGMALKFSFSASLWAFLVSFFPLTLVFCFLNICILNGCVNKWGSGRGSATAQKGKKFLCTRQRNKTWEDVVQPLPLVAVINKPGWSSGCSHLSMLPFSAPSCVCYLQLLIQNFLLLKSPGGETSKKEKSPTCYQSQVQGKPPKTLPVLPLSCGVKQKMFL